MTALHEAQWLAPIRQLQWVLHFKGTYRDADLVHRAGAQKGKAVPIFAFAPMTQTMCYNISSYCPSPKHEDHTTGEWLCLEYNGVMEQPDVFYDGSEYIETVWSRYPSSVRFATLTLLYW